MIYVELEPEPGAPLHGNLDSLVDTLLAARPGRPETAGDEASIDPLDLQPLQDLYRDLLSQHLEPIAGFIRMVRRGPRSREVLEGFRNYLSPLVQLTVAMEQQEAREIFGRFLAHIAMLEQHDGAFTYRQLEPFNLCFDLLLANVGTRLRERYLSTCFYQRNSNPLLEEIRRIRFIGPRRLQRLYTVGLVTVEGLAGAAPQEIVEVTGLPIGLARQVVDVAKQFHDQQRENRRRSLVTLCQDLREALETAAETDPGLLEGLEEALDGALATLQQVRSRPSGGIGSAPANPAKSPAQRTVEEHTVEEHAHE